MPVVSISRTRARLRDPSADLPDPRVSNMPTVSSSPGPRPYVSSRAPTGHRQTLPPGAPETGQSFRPSRPPTCRLSIHAPPSSPLLSAGAPSFRRLCLRTCRLSVSTLLFDSATPEWGHSERLGLEHADGRSRPSPSSRYPGRPRRPFQPSDDDVDLDGPLRPNASSPVPTAPTPAASHARLPSTGSRSTSANASWRGDVRLDGLRRSVAEPSLSHSTDLCPSSESRGRAPASFHHADFGSTDRHDPTRARR
jgi:hypothetical protein